MPRVLRRRASSSPRLLARFATVTAAGALAVAAAPDLRRRAAAPPRLSARAAEVVVADTGQELYGYGENRRLAIASTTKLMTALITLERVPLTKVFAQNNYYPASADSQIGLVPGERMTVHDLLVALLLPSADDAAEDLAYNVGHGSVARFVTMMNGARRAARTDPHALLDPERPRHPRQLLDRRRPAQADPVRAHRPSRSSLAPSPSRGRRSPPARSTTSPTATTWWDDSPGSPASRPATRCRPAMCWSAPGRGTGCR